MNKEEALEKAKQEGDKWLAALKLDGKPDVERIQEVLSARVFEGKPVTAYVARSMNEACDILEDLAKTANEEDLQVIANAYRCIWDYYYMAFYESACSVLEDRDFDGAEFIYQSLLPAFEAGLGFLICLGDVLIGVCLPEAHLDDEMRIHRENGPAIVYPDEKQYWWHGIQVPEEWIEDTENVDVSLCLNHDNIEQRRALCEIVGWEKVLKQLDAKVLDEDEVEGGRQLLEVDLPDAGKERFVRVRCTTGRHFCLPVDSSCKTAAEAVAWTFRLDDITEYAPEVST